MGGLTQTMESPLHGPEDDEKKKMGKIMKFFKEEKGVTAIEYALIAAGIAIAIVVIVFMVGDELYEVFNDVLTHLRSGRG